MLYLLNPSTNPRLRAVLAHALDGIAYTTLAEDADLRGKRILMAVSCDASGMDEPTLRLIRRLRAAPACMEGSVGSLIVDGCTELYTKQLAQDLTFAANSAGCLFPGKPLLEGTGSLYNQHILAAKEGLSWEETYLHRAVQLTHRLLGFQAPRFSRPKLLVLHASERGRSATLWLWQELQRRLASCMDITEVSLQNGTIHDCRGCSYSACLHFAQNGSCFYGGAVSETILPAIRECDAMLFLCPNYNDAVGANITALFNRLTSLLLQTDLYQKYLYGIVVSGYSGSDLVARQLLGTMCLNKTAMLPPRFCLLQTANDPAAVRAIPGIQEMLDQFAARMCSALCNT